MAYKVKWAIKLLIYFRISKETCVQKTNKAQKNQANTTGV